MSHGSNIFSRNGKGIGTRCFELVDRIKESLIPLALLALIARHTDTLLASGPGAHSPSVGHERDRLIHSDLSHTGRCTILRDENWPYHD